MPKTCIKCEIEKDDECFKYGKVTRTDCRDCHNKWRRDAAKKYKEESEKIKKTCTECNIEKPGTDFAYSLLICKKCKSERDKEEKHRPGKDAKPIMCNKCETEQPATEFRYQSRACKSCEKKALCEWRKENPDKFKAVCKKYRDKEDYREKQNAYKRTRYETETQYKLQTLYRNRIRMYIKGGIKKGNEKYVAMLGCSWDTLQKWLESNFADGMTWENYGTLWHIDHTMPCAAFDFTDEESIKSCFNWSNLAPMYGIDNIAKSDKINMTLVASIKEKARAFMLLHPDEILTSSLPADVLSASELVALDTKVPAKGGAGV